MIRPFLNYTRLAFTVALAIGFAGCSQHARTQRHLAKADKYFAEGQYPAAEIEYFTVLRNDSANYHAIGRLGLMYFNQGKLVNAYPYLNQARMVETNDLEVQLRSAELDLMIGAIPEAQKRVNAILDKNPKFPEAAMLLTKTVDSETDGDLVRNRLEELQRKIGADPWLEVGLGKLDLLAGHIKEATTHFEQATKLDPKCSHAYMALAGLAIMATNFADAEILFNKAVEAANPRTMFKCLHADFKFKTGYPADAENMIVEVTKTVPDYVPGWIALAKLRYQRGHLKEASDAVREALRQDRLNYDALMLNARMLLQSRRTDMAVGEYERLAGKFKMFSEVHYQLGLAYKQKGDLNKALVSFNKALSINTNYEDALVEVAMLNIRKGNPDSAIASMSQLIKRWPRTKDAYIVLADAYAAKHNYRDAHATYDRLAGILPKDPDAPFKNASLYLYRGQAFWPQARKYFEQALRIAPTLYPALDQLVAMDCAETNYAGALQRIQPELASAPNEPYLYNILGKLQIARTNRNDAEQAFKKAIELDPDFQPPYWNLAQLYHDSTNNAKALQELDADIARTSNPLGSYILKGLICSEMKDYDTARDSYEKALAMKPNTWFALNNIAEIYAMKPDTLDKAFEAARRAREVQPFNPASADTLGWIQLKRGELSWALNLLQNSAEEMPDEPVAQYHLAMAYYMVADVANASNAFTRALAITNDFPNRAEAEQRLALLAVAGGTDTHAIEVFQRQLDSQPDDSFALNRLARIYEQQSDFQKSVALYERALKRNPDNAQLLANLASLYANQLHQPEKAMQLAKDAYKFAPEDPRISALLGRLVFASGQFKWSSLLLQQSADKDSAQPGLLYDLAWAYYSIGQVPQAESTMRRALQTEPQSPRGAEARQFLEFTALGADPDKAIAANSRIQETLKTNPDFVPALMASLVAAQKQNNISEAAKSGELVLKRYPDFLPAVRQLVICYAQLGGEDDHTYQLGLKARDAAPQDMEIARAFGIIAYRHGEYQTASRVLSQAAQSGQPDAQTLYYLGMTNFQLKHLKESKTALQQALGLNLPAQLADEARRIVGQIK